MSNIVSTHLLMFITSSSFNDHLDNWHRYTILFIQLYNFVGKICTFYLQIILYWLFIVIDIEKYLIYPLLCEYIIQKIFYSF